MSALWREPHKSPPEAAPSAVAIMATTITAAARTLYPHDALPDDVYAARRGEAR